METSHPMYYVDQVTGLVTECDLAYQSPGHSRPIVECRLVTRSSSVKAVTGLIPGLENCSTVCSSNNHSFIYSYSVPAVHRRDRYAGMVQLRRQLPKCALPNPVVCTSLHHGIATSNLLHWTVWLLSTTIYIGVLRSALLHPLIVYQAFWLPLLLAISCSRTFSLLPIFHFVSLHYVAPPKLPNETRLFHKSNRLCD